MFHWCKGHPEAHEPGFFRRPSLLLYRVTRTLPLGGCCNASVSLDSSWMKSPVIFAVGSVCLLRPWHFLVVKGEIRYRRERQGLSSTLKENHSDDFTLWCVVFREMWGHIFRYYLKDDYSELYPWCSVAWCAQFSEDLYFTVSRQHSFGMVFWHQGRICELRMCNCR